MKWHQSQEPVEGMPEINLTPLIDVSLVLVVILLLTSPLAFESSLGVRHADTAVAPPAATDGGDIVEIEILNDHEVRIGKRVMDPATLEDVLPACIAATRSGEVAVRCADQVHHGTFVGVLDAAMLSGAMGIAVTEN